MKKIVSLIKVSLNHDMNIFKINSKNNKILTRYIIPILLAIYLMIMLGIYSNKLINILHPFKLEFIALTLFCLSISIISLIEGIYKSSSLLFNCKDDDLLFSLPIKKETILFTRIFKFYVFELIYNSLFILAPMIIYAVKLTPNWTYYISSIIAILILPIVPIVLSCIIGYIITIISSKFKGKNLVQTIITTAFLLLVLYISYNMDSFIDNITKNAQSINDIITKIYYPVGAYISLINDFKITTLITYILVHIVISVITIYVLGKVYFKINSNNKKVIKKQSKNNNKNYIIKTNSKTISFIKKELNRFFSTPVFITNAGFGLVLFIIACILLSYKSDTFINTVMKTNTGTNINIDFIYNIFPIVTFGIITFTSFMTSITSSMISLESKSINILKSLPIKPIEIIIYKVLAALVIMLPCILIGDLIIFIKFKFKLTSIILLLISSIILPLLSELIGIYANLKYPKLDATNDTEIVKQSMSSTISVFSGIGIIGITIVLLYYLVKKGLSNNLVILITLGIFTLITILLLIILIKTCDKDFKNIE